MPSVALTFDDGPGPSTEPILDALRDAGVHATFFVLGRNLGEAPWTDPPGDVAHARRVVARAMREGHVIGNHTYSHHRPDRWLELPEDLQRTDELIRSVRGQAGVPVDAPIPVRLPYGVRLVEQTVATAHGTANAATLDPRLAILASLGRTHVHWTSDFNDWTLQEYDGPALHARLVEHVQANLKLGLNAVLDLHDGGTGSSWGYARHATRLAVRTLLTDLARANVKIFTIG